MAYIGVVLSDCYSRAKHTNCATAATQALPERSERNLRDNIRLGAHGPRGRGADKRNPYPVVVGYFDLPGAGNGYTFITSSPKWLMTFTAILPDFGRSNGWLVALYSFDHSASSISARRAFFSFS